MYSTVVIWNSIIRNWASLVQTVENLLAMQEVWVRSLGQEDLLEKEMATHSSFLAWRIPWMEEPGSLQSMESKLGMTEWLLSLSIRNWVMITSWVNFSKAMHKILWLNTDKIYETYPSEVNLSCKVHFHWVESP